MRLTAGIKDCIEKAMIKATTHEWQERLSCAEHDLALAVRDESLGRYKSAYLGLPKRLQRTSNHIDAIVNGHRHRLFFRPEQACPTYEWHVKSKALHRRIEALVAEREKLAKTKRELRAQINSALAACSTDKQLRELWPEGAEYYEPQIKPAAGRQMVSTAALNSAIAEAKARAE